MYTDGSSASYVRQAVFPREVSPSWAAQSTLDLTSWSKINPTHNRNHLRPKSVARKLLSSSIISSVTSFTLSSWMHTHTHTHTRTHTHSDYTHCCTSSWATRCLKIKFFVHNNKMPQEFETWDFICGIRLRPAIAVTACTHRISGVFSYWHPFKQGQLEERDAWHLQLWYRDNNNLNFHIHKHIQALSIMLKVYKDRRRLQKFLNRKY